MTSFKTKYLFFSILLLCFAFFLSSQGVRAATIAAGTNSAYAGDVNISIPITLTNDIGDQVTGVNFDLDFSSTNLSVAGVTVGSAAQAAIKDQLFYTQPSPGKLRVIIFGINQNVIGDGDIVNILFDVSGEASLGAYPLALSAYAAARPDASLLPFGAIDGALTVILPPPSPPTLSVILMPSVLSGKTPLAATLTADVSGTAVGPIVYTFYCDRRDSGTDIILPYDKQQTDNNRYVCRYNKAGTYWPKVIVQREGLVAQASIDQAIIVTKK